MMRVGPDTQAESRCCRDFSPAPVQTRSCGLCGHSWVLHALEKLGPGRASACGPVEVAVPGLVLDLSSLVLYGAQAVPVRLKILLDRLYSVLTPDQVGHILQTLGWSLSDYVRGYKLQDPGGRPLDRWLTVSPEEEKLTLGQFLRFGETRPIVQLMTVPDRGQDESRRPHFGLFPGAQDLVSLCHLPPQRSRLCDSPGSRSLKPDPDTDPPLGPQDPDLPFSPQSQSRSTQSPRSPRSQSQSPRSPETPPLPGPYGPPSCFRRPLTSAPPSFLRPSSVPAVSLLTLAPARGPVLGRKGRVCCGVCGKSFYDKGTLKIHYNAVHLKIKHRCTVSGCAMVFSSLRSRNRHSANPNPRLHTCAPPGPPAPRTHIPLHSEREPRPWPRRDGSFLAPLAVPLCPEHTTPERRSPNEPEPVAFLKKKSRKSSIPVKIERDTLGQM